MKSNRKNVVRVGVGSGLAGGVAAAQAAVPAGVTTAITEATADVATIGGAVLIVAITIATFIWLRRPMH
jgi:hypothetical protein